MTPRTKLPSVEELNRLFEYKDGQLIWKTAPSRRTKVGDVAGTTHHTGYIMICLNYKDYLAHRLIYKMFTGEEPESLDHINAIKSDNRIENLRPITHQQNCALRRRKGYTFNKRAQQYFATIAINGRKTHIGSFLTEEAARCAYEVKHAEVYGKLSLFQWCLFN